MGMAASQARLLTLTARLADNELRAQSINNAKMRLAAESSRASENYINALNNATMVFTNYDLTGTSVTQPLTYNALSAYSSYNTQYGLVNSAGQLLVSESEADMFKAANGNLNNFLAAHGLNYTTTYFEKVGNLATSYPVPFDNIEVEELQSWYEEYVAYTSSSEMEEYEDLYDDYVSSVGTMNNLMEEPFDIYLGATESASAGWTVTNNTSLSTLEDAYNNNTDLNYNINKLITDGLIDDKQSFLAEVYELQSSYHSYQNFRNVVVDENATLFLESQTADTNTYLLDGKFQFVTTNDGKVININYLFEGNEADSYDKVFFDGVEKLSTASATTAGYLNIFTAESTTDAPNLYEAFDKLKYSNYIESSGEVNYTRSFSNIGAENVSKIPECNVVVPTTTEYYSDAAINEALESYNDQMIQIIKNHVNLGTFAKYMLDKTNMTFEQYLKNDSFAYNSYDNTIKLNGNTVKLTEVEQKLLKKLFANGIQGIDKVAALLKEPVIVNNKIYRGNRDTLNSLFNGYKKKLADNSADTPIGRAFAAMLGGGANAKPVMNAVENYLNSKSEFLNFVFGANLLGKEFIFYKYDEFGKVVTDENNNKKIADGESCSIYDAIEKGYIKEESITDVEFLLALVNDLAELNKDNNVTIDSVLDSDFQTVVKVFILDEIIAEYGEAKYAWIDDNDTSNTGNADAKAQWYTNLFNRMQQGYKTIENGLAASAQWIEYALESGIVTMEQVDKSYNWTPLNYKTCTRITEETDEAAVALAEAEYARAMNDIESKDNAYDMQLKNIDTEHSAIQTEYDSVKNVLGKNIDRTFKFNQSA